MLFKDGRQAIGILPCLAVLAGSVAWSLGSVLTRSLPLPDSRPLTAGAEMMLGGSLLLGRMPASRVATHAYVNPVVTIALGYFLAAEPVTLKTLFGQPR